MKKRTKKQSRKTGLPPGTLMYLGDENTEKIRVTQFLYNEKQVSETQIQNISLLKKPAENCGEILWINVDGISDVNLIKQIGQEFKLHSLLLEDVVNPNQRPKTEIYPDIIYTAIKMFYLHQDTGEIVWEYVSVILGKNYVLTFQERPGDVFETVRERLRNKTGKARFFGADYLYHILLDTIIDNYFVILEALGEDIEQIEKIITENPAESVLSDIYNEKKQLNFLKKMCWPLMEAFNSLLRQDNALISNEITYYFRDLYDHIIRIIDIIENYRDNLSGLTDIYLSITSNRMNSIMKVLTMISTIFIPLSFIAGVYGMNFKNMPELEYKYSYFIVLGIMLLIISGMMFFFKKKKWF